MDKVDGLEALFENGVPERVDVYVSTDASEIVGILIDSELVFAKWNGLIKNVEYKGKTRLMSSVLARDISCYDGFEGDLPQFLNDVGFSIRGVIGINLNGQSSGDFMNAVKRAFNDRYQNMVFVDESEERMYVRQSDYY
jgi:hypothetical protein